MAHLDPAWDDYTLATGYTTTAWYTHTHSRRALHTSRTHDTAHHTPHTTHTHEKQFTLLPHLPTRHYTLGKGVRAPGHTHTPTYTRKLAQHTHTLGGGHTHTHTHTRHSVGVCIHTAFRDICTHIYILLHALITITSNLTLLVVLFVEGILVGATLTH